MQGGHIDEVGQVSTTEPGRGACNHLRSRASRAQVGAFVCGQVGRTICGQPWASDRPATPVRMSGGLPLAQDAEVSLPPIIEQCVTTHWLV
jgi:hypothetical protein